jgi:peptidyl-prolyl cis-trans isomerase C
MTLFDVAARGAMLALIFTAGCNLENKSGDMKPAAVVNGRVIPAEQIQADAKQLGNVMKGESTSIENMVLKNVVDQELLAQEAVKDKLDQTSDVSWKLEAARRQILAQAELGAMTKDVAEATDAEIKSYYDGHPELFAHHKIYQLANLVADTTSDNIDKARALAKKSGNVRDLVAALHAQGIQVGGQQVVKAAEELPKELLEKFAELKTGQSLTVDHGGKLNILVLQGVEESPVSLEQATQKIRQYLTNDKKRKVAETKLKKIYSQAKIEYKAPYAAVNQ